MTGFPAYFWRYHTPYVAWFCLEEDVRTFLENGEEAETLAPVGTEPQPGVTYHDVGHGHCWADDCPGE